MTADEIIRLLDEIGTRIGPAGEYAWALTVRQVVVDSIAWGIAGVVIIAAAVGLVVWARQYNARNRANHGYDDTMGIEWLLVLFALPVGVFLLAVSFTQILNPEYHAMIRLLGAVLP